MIWVKMRQMNLAARFPAWATISGMVEQYAGGPMIQVIPAQCRKLGKRWREVPRRKSEGSQGNPEEQWFQLSLYMALHKRPLPDH